MTTVSNSRVESRLSREHNKLFTTIWFYTTPMHQVEDENLYNLNVTHNETSSYLKLRRLFVEEW